MVAFVLFCLFSEEKLIYGHSQQNKKVTKE